MASASDKAKMKVISFSCKATNLKTDGKGKDEKKEAEPERQ